MTVGSLGAAAVLVLAACDSRQAREQPKPPPVAAGALDIPSWVAGKQYSYDTQLKSDLVLGGHALMAFDLSAKLSMATRQVGTQTEFIVRLSRARFKGDSLEAQQQFAALTRELEAPFAFSTEQGRLSALRLPPNWSQFAVSISRTIAAGFQVAPRPANQQGDSWRASEIDATGRYDAEYRPAKGDATLLSKQKLAYASVSLGKTALGQFGAKVTPQVVESKGSVRLGAGAGAPQLAAVELNEKLKVQLTATSLVDSSTSLKLSYEGLDPGQALAWDSLDATTRKLAPDQVPASPGAGPNYDAERIGDYTFAKAFAELEAQARDPKRNQLLDTVRDQPFEPEQLQEREAKLQLQGRAFTALAALLRTDSKNIPRALAGVKARSPALRGLLDALASAGTPEAQAALVSIMNDDKAGLPLQRAAAGSLARTGRASPESVLAFEAHVATADPLHVHALYGLGTIARRLRDAGDVARADAIAQGLVAALGKVSAPADQVDVLRAIANSGAASAFEAVQPYLTSSVASVRVGAVDALRLMQRPEVDGILIERLSQPEVQLQGAALDAISVRMPTTALVAALERATLSAAKPALRLKAVRILALWLPQRPEVRPILERLSSDDELEQIRKAAKSALGA